MVLTKNRPEKINLKKAFNLLLVMPKRNSSSTEIYPFALGLPSISSVLKLIGINVFNLNLCHHDEPIEKIICDYITRHDINAVATGGNSPEYGIIKNIISAIKYIDRSLITIVGGGIISAEPQIAMSALENVDYGVFGEGEVTICELVLYLEKNLTGEKRKIEFNERLANSVNGGVKISKFHKQINHVNNISDIKGLIFWDGHKYCKNADRQELQSLDILPWPDYEGFEIEKLLKIPGSSTIGGSGTEGTLFVSSSRSCPFNCTFCFHTSGKKYRQRDISDFINQVEYMIEHYSVKYITIVDELFASNIERVFAFGNAMKKYKGKVKWFASFRVSDITGEMIDLLKVSGCINISIGIESADNRVLKSMRKGITIEQTERALELIYSKGLSTNGGFILGDIAETSESANKTLDFIEKHPEFDLFVNFVCPYPGTYIYKYACSKKIISDPVEYLKKGCPRVNISKLTNEEYTRLFNRINNFSRKTRRSNLFKAMLIHSIDSMNSKVTFSAECAKCGAVNTYKNERIIHDEFLLCPDCNKRNYIDYPKVILGNIDANLKLLLQKHKRVVLWGVLECIIMLSEKLDAMRSSDFYYTDATESKWSHKVSDYIKVFSPDVFNQKDINAVIIAPLNHIFAITEMIKDEYLRVEYFYSANDLVMSPEIFKRKKVFKKFEELL